MSQHSHYFKPVPPNVTHIDVYRVLQMFNVTDPCIQHAVKKLLVAGGRGAGKDIKRDIQESIDSLERWKFMREEELTSSPPPAPGAMPPAATEITPRRVAPTTASAPST